MEFQFNTFEASAQLGRILTSSFYAKGRIPYRTEKILPTGKIAVLFNIGKPHRLGRSPEPDQNPAFPHSWIDGMRTSPIYHTPTDGTHVLGLLFEPIGFHAIFGVDMVLLKDRVVDARTVLPEDFNLIIERQLPAASDEESHATIHDKLLAYDLLPIPDWLWEFYDSIVANRGAIKLEEHYARSGRSSRYATELFKRCVGVTPKVLCRIHRLLALLEEVDPIRDVSWTELAQRFGFFDQAHFNHEFKQLSGLIPSEYLEQRRRNLPDLGQGESVAFAPQP